jgi:hypothetical protein
MKTVLKTLLPVAILAAASSVSAGTTCGLGATHSDYYKLDSGDTGTTIKVSLQGYGSMKLPTKQMGGVAQSMEMTPDCKFTSVISIKLDPASSPVPVFTLTGSWSYPAESKVIYFTIDGDISQGDTSTGTWGALFNPSQITGIAGFLPLLLNPAPPAQPKLDLLTLIYPSVIQKTGTIKLSPKGDTAVMTTIVTGRAIAKSATKLTTKEVGFSFGASTKATVSTTPPAP